MLLHTIVPAGAHSAGFLQWKALLCLLLECERGPLRSHTGMFVAFLITLQQQLVQGLGQQPRQAHRHAAQSDSSEFGAADSEQDGRQQGGEGACSLGQPLVEELLVDSFLRRQLRAFLSLLHESVAEVPPALAKQVGLKAYGFYVLHNFPALLPCQAAF